MTIFVEMDFQTGQHILMVRSKGMSAMPAGPRILRGPPHPAIKWEHDDPEQAEKDAEVLRKYLAAMDTKGQSKRELREAGRDFPPPHPT